MLRDRPDPAARSTTPARAHMFAFVAAAAGGLAGAWILHVAFLWSGIWWSPVWTVVGANVGFALVAGGGRGRGMVVAALFYAALAVATGIALTADLGLERLRHDPEVRAEYDRLAVESRAFMALERGPDGEPRPQDVRRLMADFGADRIGRFSFVPPTPETYLRNVAPRLERFDAARPDFARWTAERHARRSWLDRCYGGPSSAAFDDLAASLAGLVAAASVVAAATTAARRHARRARMRAR